MAVQRLPAVFTEKKTANPPQKMAGNFQCGQLLTEKTKSFEDSYQLQRKLGKGAFGEVWVCLQKEKEKEKEGSKEYACKIFDKSNVKTEDEKQDIQKEVAILRTFQNEHKSIIQLVDVLESDVALHVIMEMCNGGDLFELLKVKGKLPEPAARLVFKQMASALEHCHSKGVIHRDIKPENILFQGHTDWLYLMGMATDFQAPVHVKLADFGLSVSLKPGETTSGYTGSRYYISPEMILGKPYGRRADIWSMGVVLCAMLTGRLPFSGQDRTDDDGLLRAILRGKVNFNAPSWAGVSECAKDLVRGMLQVEPANRLRAVDLLYHPWLTKPKPWSAASLRQDADLSATRSLRHTQSVTTALTITPSSEDGQPPETTRLRALATEEFPLGCSPPNPPSALTTPLKGTFSRGIPSKPRSEESFRVRGRSGLQQRGEGSSLHRSSSLLGSLSRQGAKILSALQGKTMSRKVGNASERDGNGDLSSRRVQGSMTAEGLPEALPVKLIGDEGSEPWVAVKQPLPVSRTLEGSNLNASVIPKTGRSGELGSVSQEDRVQPLVGGFEGLGLGHQSRMISIEGG